MNETPILKASKTYALLRGYIFGFAWYNFLLFVGFISKDKIFRHGTFTLISASIVYVGYVIYMLWVYAKFDDIYLYADRIKVKSKFSWRNKIVSFSSITNWEEDNPPAKNSRASKKLKLNTTTTRLVIDDDYYDNYPDMRNFILLHISSRAEG